MERAMWGEYLSDSECYRRALRIVKVVDHKAFYFNKTLSTVFQYERSGESGASSTTALFLFESWLLSDGFVLTLMGGCNTWSGSRVYSKGNRSICVMLSRQTFTNKNGETKSPLFVVEEDGKIAELVNTKEGYNKIIHQKVFDIHEWLTDGFDAAENSDKK